MYEFLPDNSPFNPYNLTLREVPHILIPGRGRLNHGTELTPDGFDRVAVAAELYLSDELSPARGFVVPAGYKTPAERDSMPVQDSASGEWLEGIPEGILMAQALQKLGVPAAAINPETRSIDTVTNLVHAEDEDRFGKFDRRPVAIVAQEAHLDRIVHFIAKKTLRRDFVGIVVPESEPDRENPAARLFSHMVLLGISPDNPDIRIKTDTRAGRLWDAMLGVRSTLTRLSKPQPQQSCPKPQT